MSTTLNQVEPYVPSQEAAELHANSIVIDGSAVIIESDAHFERVDPGGVTATNHTVTIPGVGLTEALRQINSFRRWLDENPDRIRLCTSTKDIHDAKASGREAAILGPQDSLFLGTDLSLVGTFWDLGLRVLQLTYQKRNWVGDGCGETNPAGLSGFGRSLVKELNAFGILIDLSHCSKPTTLDAIEHSDQPVVLTHAHPNAVTPHIRAKDDETLKAIATTGGVVGVTALSSFNKMAFGVRPGLVEFVRHVHYLIDLLGVDHVGIGLDFDETNTPEKHARDIARNPELEPVKEFEWDDRRVRDLSRGAHFPNVTGALLDSGLDSGDVQKILGLNFLRVFDQVWRA
ncbi:membrane dipeptidase [Dactylosporangium roseum]|uniref:Membrane dipeptidase n=1 Tax=Dactylosporangium roseum TaxID=47989 RepID=A0ABY5Z1L2_9ACTN|nr:dipeptidase [Dactylosporangium roseum]UWZ34638.1 membrane dipeptidase [Dactylosporangium roseum]